MAEVNEKTTAYLTVIFLDKSGNQEPPSSATWQVHDVESGEQMKAETPIDPIAAQVELTIPASVNAIVNAAKASERRRVTIKAVYGSDDGLNDQWEYSVKNLSKVT